jgi:hypothetical protein
VTTPAELVLSPRDLLTALGLSEITHKDLLSCHPSFFCIYCSKSNTSYSDSNITWVGDTKQLIVYNLEVV